MFGLVSSAGELATESPAPQEPVGEDFSLVREACLFAAILAVLTVFVVLLEMRVDYLVLEPRPVRPQTRLENGQVTLLVPGYTLTAEVARYQDEMFAYLMFDHFRRNRAFDAGHVYLTFEANRAKQPYRIVYRPPDEFISAIENVAFLTHAGLIVPDSAHLVPAFESLKHEQQSQLFLAAYSLPVRKRFEELPETAISRYLHRFIRFKSSTDRRIRLQMEPVPTRLSPADAQRLAGDIITIAQFYSVPLDLFLGIGAMENNYMNVRGDLAHTIWKRRPAKDDIIVERKRGRVRVLNDSAGVWQITRETLRYAHRLFKKDSRDYSALPEHLRPPENLNVNEVDAQVLTTYSGLLLRDLLDRFDGDVLTAAGAYNGGPGNPNLKYGEGVRAAAEHARRVMEQAAALNGESVMRTRWLRPGR
jgi:hypothetical protein